MAKSSCILRLRYTPTTCTPATCTTRLRCTPAACTTATCTLWLRCTLPPAPLPPAPRGCAAPLPPAPLPVRRSRSRPGRPQPCTHRQLERRSSSPVPRLTLYVSAAPSTRLVPQMVPDQIVCAGTGLLWSPGSRVWLPVVAAGVRFLPGCGQAPELNRRSPAAPPCRCVKLR